MILKGLINRFSNIKMSIRSRIILTIVFVIFMMGSLNVLFLIGALDYNAQYGNIVTNITRANKINGALKTSIDLEMYEIVAGKKKFEEGRQYEIINSVNRDIMDIMPNVTTAENRTRLDVTLRTLKTLTHYVDVIGEQIKNKRPVAESEKTLEEIWSVSSLVEEDIQEFILYEVESCETVRVETDKNITRWIWTDIIVLAVLLIFSALAAWFISGSISKPIRELRNMTKSIAAGNLDVRVENINKDEIAGLSNSFNNMAEKIKELLEKNTREQENLKKSELRALQAQINPHFLYNTLDTIVWMAEANKSEQVIEIVRALSNFFRITLSKGKDWITVRDEVEHIRSYLIIQKIRYRDILDFTIDVEDEINDCQVLKLTLQPIVENALYHGIKNKREGGRILIQGGMGPEETLWFTVTDDGIGMDTERLHEVQAELEDEMSEPVQKASGFGLSNVHKRIKLYYGKQYGVNIESEYKIGTKITVRLPRER